MEPSIEFLRTQLLTKGLTDDELVKIQPFFKRMEFERNEEVIEEGDLTNDLYLIEEGEVKILKWDEAQLFRLTIGKLGRGEVFGEMSFVDSSPRSTSIETVKHTILYALSQDSIKSALPGIQDIYNKLVANILSINFNRLRANNVIYSKTLRSSFRYLQSRIDQGILIFSLGLFFGLFNFASMLINQRTTLNHNLSFFAYWIILLIPAIFVIKKLGLYLNQFGVTFNNIKQTLIETPIFLIVGFLALYLWRGFVPFSQSMAMTPILVIGYFLYCCAVEFIGRGILQTSVKNMLSDEVGMATVVSTSVFLTCVPFFYILNYSWVGLIFIFISNLYFGCMFLRHKNLIGVVLAHFLLGIYFNFNF